MERKLFLSGIIVIGCYVAGKMFGDGLKRRRDTLAQLIKKLSEAESYMVSGVPVKEIYKKISGDDEVGKMFYRMWKNPEVNREKAWETELEKISINGKDKKLLKDFFEVFGTSTTDIEKNNFRVVLTALSNQLDEAENKYKNEGHIYHKLGFCAGLLLSIFFA